MSRFLFCSTDFSAHLDWGGLLSTAHLLAEKHDVLWATGGHVAPQVRAAGVPPVIVPVVDPNRYRRGIEPPVSAQNRQAVVETWRAAFRLSTSAFATAPASLVHRYALLVHTVVDRWLQEDAIADCCLALNHIVDTWRPDVIIAEPLMLPAALVARARHVRLASCGYPGRFLLLHSIPILRTVITRVRDVVARVCKRMGCVDPTSHQLDLFFDASELQLVYFPKDWFGDLAAPASPGAAFVGGGNAHNIQRYDRRTTPQADRARTVVLAVSSSYAPSRDVLDGMFEAVARIGGTGVIGGGDQIRQIVQPIPSHIRCENWLDYDSLLPRADVLIHHGGLGTTHAAVRAALPQVILPEVIDQCLHSEAVERSGAGVVQIGEVVADRLEQALRQVLSCVEYRERARVLQSRFAECGGVPAAATRLAAMASA